MFNTTHKLFFLGALVIMASCSADDGYIDLRTKKKSGSRDEDSMSLTRGGATIGFAAPSAEGTEENLGKTPVSVQVRLSSAQPKDVVVPLTVGGTATPTEDHSLGISAEVRIPAGSLIGTFTFDVKDDNVFESDETVTLSMRDPKGRVALEAQRVFTLTIKNGLDTAPAVQWVVTSSGHSSSRARPTARRWRPPITVLLTGPLRFRPANSPPI